MAEKISPEEFIRLSDHIPVIDVRSPSEYGHAHIPKAINIPLFDDTERARIGTLYNHEGKITAVQNGLKIVAPKMVAFTKSALRLNSDKLLLHCWRGGMRSASMAWLFETVDIRCMLLEGGYKAYRNHVLDFFRTPFKIVLLGGKTGAGKTEILAGLAKTGEQVIDLEALANHKGSAFGAMGQAPQPSSEQFEHLIFDKLRKFDPRKIIWMEDESRNIGKAFIPQHLWDQMRCAPMIRVDTDDEIRVRRLMRDYTCFSTEEIVSSIKKIEKRLGSEKCRKAIEACCGGKTEDALRICLAYYDRMYSSQLESRFCEFPEKTGSIEVQNLECSDETLHELIDKSKYFYHETGKNDTDRQ